MEKVYAVALLPEKPWGASKFTEGAQTLRNER
jgi:hypothetical protein